MLRSFSPAWQKCPIQKDEDVGRLTKEPPRDGVLGILIGRPPPSRPSASPPAPRATWPQGPGTGGHPNRPHGTGWGNMLLPTRLAVPPSPGPGA